MTYSSSWLRFRVPLGFLMAAWFLVIARPVQSAPFVLGAVLALLGCLLRSWAAGYLLKGKRVAIGGPYAYVRNPLYLGSLLIGVGLCLTLWQQPLPWQVAVLWALFLFGFAILYWAKSRAEEKELVASLGRDYEMYAAKVPAFLPVRGRVADLGPQRFSGELYHRNREYQCIVGTLAVLGMLYGRYYFGV